MGKDANEERERKGSRGLNRNRGAGADWQTVDGELLKRAIASASNAGGCLRLGYTRDGGAYAIGIYGDGDVYTEFANDQQSLEEVLTAICQLFDDLLDAKKLGRKGK